MIIPKKEILYAPMLGTLGGGSSRGFGQRTGGTFFLYAFTSFIFTTAGQEGRQGPTLPTLRANPDYAATSWASNNEYFTMTTRGIQQWQVPISGTYRITARGAEGGRVMNETTNGGGLGTIMQGQFTFEGGEWLNIIVGQRGKRIGGSSATETVPGGGGGSFVWNRDDDAEPLIVAGGGGGQTDDPVSSNRHVKYHAIKTTSGQYAYSGSNITNGAGGTNGNGGQTNENPGANDTAGAGGGFKTNGESFSNTSAVWGIAAKNGGLGGEGGQNTTPQQYGVSPSDQEGGFGGGGGGDGWYGCSGGGGGYSGGGSTRDSPRGAGGGGGSYNAGTNQINLDYYSDSTGNYNDGQVQVVFLG